jgi:hypothetical protein
MVKSANLIALIAVPLMTLLCACGSAGSGMSGGPSSANSLASASASASGDPYSVARSVHAAGSNLHHALAVARGTYANEINGGRVHADWQLIAADQAFLNDLASGDLAAAQTEATYQMKSNAIKHITRVSLVRGNRALVNAVWNYNGVFVVAPLERPLYAHGRNLGTLLVSVQDVVGYVKLIRRFTGDEAVVRGSSGQVRSSLPAAARVSLPSSGLVTIGGRKYRVGSFQVGGWGGETLTVSVLEPA